jgi:hypothetical protein
MASQQEITLRRGLTTWPPVNGARLKGFGIDLDD